ncbi:MAG: endonuclease/exonuclease/phosphatase family protein [Actinomycetes bacterium]
MLVRTWNLCHGNTVPLGRKAYLREMVELATADQPDIVCFQEVPAWALEKMGEWTGMTSTSARARGATVGPVRIPSGVGKALTSLNHGKLRSAFSGQGNVILVPHDARITGEKTITLNTNPFCEEEGKKLGLDEKMMRWWEHERRVCQIAHVELASGRRLLVANLHATSYPKDVRLPDAELRRATRFIDRQSEIDEVVVAAGDFNITRADSKTIVTLLALPKDDRWSDTGPQIDHVLVRGAATGSVRVWTDEERVFDGKLLSDHAPVDVDVLAGRVRTQASAEVRSPSSDAIG